MSLSLFVLERLPLQDPVVLRLADSTGHCVCASGHILSGFPEGFLNIPVEAARWRAMLVACLVCVVKDNFRAFTSIRVYLAQISCWRMFCSGCNYTT